MNNFRAKALASLSYDQLLDACIKAENSEAARVAEVVKLCEENFKLKEGIESAILSLSTGTFAPHTESSFMSRVSDMLRSYLK